jgi:hypothetical protein
MKWGRTPRIVCRRIQSNESEDYVGDADANLKLIVFHSIQEDCDCGKCGAQICARAWWLQLECLFFC